MDDYPHSAAADGKLMASAARLHVVVPLVERTATQYLGRMGRLDLMDDVVSDTLWDLAQVPPEAPIGNPSGYAKTATRNHAKAVLKADAKRRQREAQWRDFLPQLTADAQERRWVEMLVHRFLDRYSTELTVRQRNIFRLVLEGKLFKEIASVLEVDRKTVFNDLRRLQALLVVFYESFDPDDDPDPPPGGRGPRDSGAKKASTRAVVELDGSSVSRERKERRIVVSTAVALKVIMQTLENVSKLRMGTMQQLEEGSFREDIQRRVLTELERLLLDLPAFRGLGGSELDQPRLPRCDSLDEILERLVVLIHHDE